MISACQLDSRYGLEVYEQDSVVHKFVCIQNRIRRKAVEQC